MDSPEGSLSDADVRAVVRLLGEVAGSSDPLNSRRTQLMTGLANLVQADTWTWSLMGEIDPQHQPAHTVFLHGGFSEGQLRRYFQIQEHPDMQRLTAPFVQALLEGQTQVTRRDQEMAPDEVVQAADVFPLLQQAELEWIIASGRPTSAGQLSVISVFRSGSKPRFSARDARLMHIVLSEVGWLHDTAWPQHPRQGITSLSPRLRTVLALLLQGSSRKRISSDLDISLNTVHGYVKEIFAAFEVHSHAELMQRFHQGDGGDLIEAA